MAQPAWRLLSTMRLGSTFGAEPFSKMEDLITETTATLEPEADATEKADCDMKAAADATERAYCDLKAAIEKLPTQTDSMTVKSPTT